MITFKKTAAVGGMVIALVLGGINASAADPASGVAAVHAADQAWTKAYNTGDVDTVVSLYDEHAVIYPPGAPVARGRAAIRAFFVKDNAESLKGGLTFSLGANPDGGVSGDMAWASGTYKVTDKSGHVVDTGWYFSVSRKKNGKWLYVRDAWNSDGPAAGTPPAAPAKK